MTFYPLHDNSIIKQIILYYYNHRNDSIRLRHTAQTRSQSLLVSKNHWGLGKGHPSPGYSANLIVSMMQIRKRVGRNMHDTRIVTRFSKQRVAWWSQWYLWRRLGTMCTLSKFFLNLRYKVVLKGIEASQVVCVTRFGQSASCIRTIVFAAKS